MVPALLVMGKDLKQRLRDSSALVMAFVLPLALAIIFSLTLGNVEEISFNYGYVDQDKGALAAAFRNKVLGGAAEEGLLEVVDAGSIERATRLVEEGEVQAAIIVPAGFSAGVLRGETPDFQVIGNAQQGLATEVARSIADAYAQDINASRLALATSLRPGQSQPNPAEMAAIAQRAAQAPQAVEISGNRADRRELGFKNYFSAGIAVFFVFFTVQFGVASILEERKEATLGRLFAMPVSRGSVIAGKLLGALVLGLCSMAVLMTATALVLGVRWGNLLGVAMLVVSGVLAAVAILALVATLAKTSEQAGSWQTMIAIVLGMFGGSFFSLAQAGEVFATIGRLTPHSWFLRGLADLSGGAGPGAVLPSVMAILTFALVAGGIAALRRRRLIEL